MKTTFSSVVIGDSLSALADGELSGNEFDQMMLACERDPGLLGSWQEYHLIGDVLRSPDLSLMGSSAEFLTRLQSRLAHETLYPHVPAAVDISAQSAKPMVIAPLLMPHQSANDPVFRWKLVAGFASVVTVAVTVWMVTVQTGFTGPQLAQSSLSSPSSQVSQPVLVASPQGSMLRDARLEELLAAHKQVAGNSALQMPSGFLRNATFETMPNARH